MKMTQNNEDFMIITHKTIEPISAGLKSLLV